MTRRWEEGVVIGMSGEGVLPISNLTLAKVSGMGITVSGNGGAMDYKAAANFLALGAQTVQFCTIVMKYGLGYRGRTSFRPELSDGGARLPLGEGTDRQGAAAIRSPISWRCRATKKLPAGGRQLCEHCGNCARCPYQAIVLDGQSVPTFDASHCIGCSLCAQKCFAGAISMRDRTPQELAALNEG